MGWGYTCVDCQQNAHRCVCERPVLQPCGCKIFRREYQEHGCRVHGYWSAGPDAAHAWITLRDVIAAIDMKRASEADLDVRFRVHDYTAEDKRTRMLRGTLSIGGASRPGFGEFGWCNDCGEAITSFHNINGCKGSQQEQIRTDVVIAVRYALASLPEQSRMLEALSGHYYNAPLRSLPVEVSKWR